MLTYLRRRSEGVVLVLLTIIVTMAVYYNQKFEPRQQEQEIKYPDPPPVQPLHNSLNKENNFQNLAKLVEPPAGKVTSYQQARDLFFSYDKNACKSTAIWGGRMWNGVYLVGKGWTDAMDGNYTLCMDPGLAPKRNDCLIYSFGVGTNWSFEEEAELWGCDIYSFDPSIGLKPHDHSKRIHFYDYGLTDYDTDSGPNGWKMRRLETIIKELGHTNRIIDVLKIDIEHSEHEVFPDIVKSGLLDKVRQIPWEIHNFKKISVEQYVETFNILERAGFVNFFSEDWPYPNEDFKKPDGSYDPTFYIFSNYNKKFRKESR